MASVVATVEIRIGRLLAEDADDLWTTPSGGVHCDR